MVKQKCKRCGKTISGKIKIITYRKKLGNKSIVKVEMYDEACFKIKNKERAINERSR
ncbi:hypothetical protein LCGC14_1252110 [marine sediment metagenome]|uniref:PARP-type domain-containing protein n=1 Tax=marine sediment metagenome TaxID=412755 RepID=A0A0F9NJU3_9ZZZZ